MKHFKSRGQCRLQTTRNNTATHSHVPPGTKGREGRRPKGTDTARKGAPRCCSTSAVGRHDVPRRPVGRRQSQADTPTSKLVAHQMVGGGPGLAQAAGTPLPLPWQIARRAATACAACVNHPPARVHAGKLGQTQRDGGAEPVSRRRSSQAQDEGGPHGGAGAGRGEGMAEG